MSPHLFKPRENKWLKRPKHLSKTARDTGQKTTELQAQFAIWTSQSLFNTVQNCIFSPIVRKARIFFFNPTYVPTCLHACFCLFFSLSLTVLSTEREICLFQAERELGFLQHC